MSASSGTLSWLEQPRTYLDALRQLRERQSALVEAASGAELSLTELPQHVDSDLARLLARLVSAGSYTFGAVEEKRAHLGGKWRILYRASLVDTVVLMVLARVTTRLLDPLLSPRVYSYRKGRSSRQAVRDLARLVREHRAGQGDVRARGLHVVRRDIAAYGDSIPVHDGSQLWPALHDALVAAGCPASHSLHSLLDESLRPQVRRLSGAVEQPLRGVPMGSPLQPIICNFYLRELDEELDSLPDGYYARFGDDLLFAHPNSSVAARAAESIARHVKGLELQLNAAKSADVFWNGAGRSPASPFVAGQRGTTHVDYLGARVSFAGGIMLGVHKLRRVRRELAERLRVSRHLLADATPPERLEALLSALGHALEPGSDVAVSLAAELWADCDDRRELAQLDYWLARRLAEELVGRRGVRAFRSVSYRRLRESGLVSTVARRRRARLERRDKATP